MIHLNIWAPHSVQAPTTGCSFFLIIVDDFSRFTWVHFLRNKSDVVFVMTSFLNMVQTQFHTRVKCIRSVNAGELCGGGMKRLYNAHGILIQASSHKWRHKHLLETARSLYIKSKVPQKYWGECV